MLTCDMVLQKILLLPVAAAILMCGCAGTKSGIYDNEEFISGSAYSHHFPGTGPATCEAARRALLSQGYLISEAKPTLVKGSKNFQRDGGNHAEIEFSVVCAVDTEGSNTTTAFANAVRALYSLKKSSNSASVGVGVLGSLSLPFGLSDDSLVKVGAETISSKKFYDQFFVELERYLGDPDTDPDPTPQPAMTPPFVPPEPVFPKVAPASTVLAPGPVPPTPLLPARTATEAASGALPQPASTHAGTIRSGSAPSVSIKTIPPAPVPATPKSTPASGAPPTTPAAP